jgi:hypothetical protein
LKAENCSLHKNITKIETTVENKKGCFTFSISILDDDNLRLGVLAFHLPQVAKRDETALRDAFLAHQ